MIFGYQLKSEHKYQRMEGHSQISSSDFCTSLTDIEAQRKRGSPWPSWMPGLEMELELGQFTCISQGSGDPWQCMIRGACSTPSPFTCDMLLIWGDWKSFEGKIGACSQLKTAWSISIQFIWSYRRICVLYLIIDGLLGTGAQWFKVPVEPWRVQ